jgi:hypothetical protein
MKELAAVVCAAAAGLMVAACSGGNPAPTPAPTTASSTVSSAFPVYVQGSSSYNALLACIFDAGYRSTPKTSQRTITPADAGTEVVLHTAGCPGAF